MQVHRRVNGNGVDPATKAHLTRQRIIGHRGGLEDEELPPYVLRGLGIVVSTTCESRMPSKLFQVRQY